MIRESMGIDLDMLNEVQKRQLIWFRHVDVNRMEKRGLPKKVLQLVTLELKKMAGEDQDWNGRTA